VSKFVFEGPAGYGAHHADDADDPLHERGIYPGVDAAPGQSMADLDLEPGTVVELDTDDDPDSETFGAVHRDDDADAELIIWTDKFGTARRTAVPAAYFAEHFREQED